MDIKKIKAKAKAHKYDTTLLYDADEKAYGDDVNRLYKEFEKDCRDAVEKILGKITNKQFNIVFSKVWEDNFLQGHYKVICCLDEVVDTISLSEDKINYRRQ